MTARTRAARPGWGRVDPRAADRLSMATGLVTSLAVGMPSLLAALGPGAGPPPLWWAGWAAHLAAFLLLDVPVARRPAGLSDRALLAGMAGAGALAYVLAPPLGWTAVLLVLTAVCAAFILTPRGTAALVVAQTALIGVVSLMGAPRPVDALMAMLVYAGFQAFGVLVVAAQRREGEARAELARANAELRTATALLEEASRTAERLRIARELHDLVGHQLTALTLELEVASHSAAGPAAVHVRRARGVAKDLLADVRTAVGELRAAPQDLRHALQVVVADLPRPAVHLSVADDLEVDDATTVALVRCVQEIVTNAVRHADAANLWISLRPRPGGGVQLEAHDDGQGAPALRPGNGLTGMRERIEGLGGAFGVSSGAGSGVRLVAEVPAR